jgi:hypothetical protein
MAKSIIITRGKTAVPPKQNLPHAIHDATRYGMWCKVLARYSIDHTVDVETAEGFTVTRIPVASREWVTLDDPTLGERNLPPVSSMVFMFMPTGGIDNAFIMGSCFLPSYDKHVTEFLVEKKEDEEFAKSEGGWQRTFDKATGDLEVVGTDEDDKTLTITIKRSEKKIQITDWNDNDLVVDKNGIKVTDTKGNTATWDDSGTNFEDKNGNEITTSGSGIVMEDKNGNRITMNAGGMKAEDKNGNIMDMTAAGTTFTAIMAQITGGALEVNGTAAPTGSGPFCAIPACPFGMPHVGNLVSGT